MYLCYIHLIIKTYRR